MAVIKESLRLSALVTSRLPLISPDNALFFREWEIPAGVSECLLPKVKHCSQLGVYISL